MFSFLIKGVELKDGLVRQDVIYGDRHEKGAVLLSAFENAHI